MNGMTSFPTIASAGAHEIRKLGHDTSLDLASWLLRQRMALLLYSHVISSVTI